MIAGIRQGVIDEDSELPEHRNTTTTGRLLISPEKDLRNQLFLQFVRPTFSILNSRYRDNTIQSNLQSQMKIQYNSKDKTIPTSSF